VSVTLRAGLDGDGSARALARDRGLAGPVSLRELGVEVRPSVEAFGNAGDVVPCTHATRRVGWELHGVHRAVLTRDDGTRWTFDYDGARVEDEVTVEVHVPPAEFTLEAFGPGGGDVDVARTTVEGEHRDGTYFGAFRLLNPSASGRTFDVTLHSTEGTQAVGTLPPGDTLVLDGETLVGCVTYRVECEDRQGDVVEVPFSFTYVPTEVTASWEVTGGRP